MLFDKAFILVDLMYWQSDVQSVGCLPGVASNDLLCIPMFLYPGLLRKSSFFCPGSHKVYSSELSSAMLPLIL